MSDDHLWSDPISWTAAPAEGIAGDVDMARALLEQLAAQRSQAERSVRYYQGDQPFRLAGKKFRETFEGLFGGFAENVCELVVDSLEERLAVEGFRASKKPEADDALWQIWQDNGLDAESAVAHLEALIHGRCAVLVQDVGGIPQITVESPNEVTVLTDARRRRLGAIKTWRSKRDATLVLWTPGRRVTWNATHSRAAWEVAEIGDGPADVPVVPIINRRRVTQPWGRSELASIIPVQNAINKTMMDALVASEYGAFPQRWVTGLEIVEDPVTRQPIEPFRAAIDKVLQASPADAKFGQFQAADLSNYVSLVAQLVQHVASISRVPFHYFALNGGNIPSGEALRSAEAGLVAKARARQREWGEAWEDVMRIAVGITGGPVDNSMETIWRNPEFRTEGELIDSLVKKKSFGVPNRQLWEDAGYSPEQIGRFAAMVQDEAWTAALAQPAAQQIIVGGGPTR